LQVCVGGPIEAAGYIFCDEPAVYVNVEGILGASLETANRAVYATRQMAEAGYLSQMDFSHAVAEGKLYSIVFGDMVWVGFDPETGENRDITDAESERVVERFGGVESIGSTPSNTSISRSAGRPPDRRLPPPEPLRRYSTMPARRGSSVVQPIHILTGLPDCWLRPP
jgi:hypothetical protein